MRLPLFFLTTRLGGVAMVAASIAVACVLSGCAESPEEKAARQDALCQSYGAKPGTDQYIQCRATIHMGEVLDKRARDGEANTSLAMGLAIGAATTPARR